VTFSVVTFVAYGSPAHVFEELKFESISDTSFYLPPLAWAQRLLLNGRGYPSLSSAAVERTVTLATGVLIGIKYLHPNLREM